MLDPNRQYSGCFYLPCVLLSLSFALFFLIEAQIPECAAGSRPAGLLIYRDQTGAMSMIWTRLFAFSLGHKLIRYGINARISALCYNCIIMN